MPIGRGERVIEGVFNLRARVEGNDTGYDTIAASGPHATTLHWVRNTGAVRKGDLLLLDAGVEGHELYTADVTRTMPINGTFSPAQRRIYDLVYEAQSAGIAAVRPGANFMDPHDAAMKVLAQGLFDLGILKEEPEDALRKDRQLHRRYTLHGTSHMLGIDVHDCANARNEFYWGTWKRATSSRSSPASTSRRTTSPCPRSIAASGCASKTTCSSRQTVRGISRRHCPVQPTRSKPGWRRAGPRGRPTSGSSRNCAARTSADVAAPM